MFCFHKYGPEVDRKQTCTKCGAIRIVPCTHKWEQLDTSYIGANRDYSGKIYSWEYRVIRLHCEKCGEQRDQTVA